MKKIGKLFLILNGFQAAHAAQVAQPFVQVIQRKSLLEKINAKQNDLGQTLLMLAALNGKWEAVEQYLQCNATASMKDSQGLDALYYAKKCADNSVAKERAIQLLQDKLKEENPQDYSQEIEIQHVLIEKPKRNQPYWTDLSKVIPTQETNQN